MGFPRPDPHDTMLSHPTSPCPISTDTTLPHAVPRNAVRRPTLGQVVAYLKYQSTKRINVALGAEPGSVWQRNYYERVIRDEQEYERAWRYIEDNPTQWQFDRENPDYVSGGI